MNSLSLHRPWHSLVAAFLIPILAFLLACGPGEEPTPIPTATAVPTTAPAATPTSALPGPVASPTPTSVATPTPGEQPRRGGRMLITTSYYMPDYDFQVTGSVSDPNTLGGKLHNNLYINPSREIVECEICTEWHLENGGKTTVFNLVQGIKFHNGQELTSADVKWSLRKIMGEVDGIPSPRNGVIKEYVESIETPSRYVLKLNLIRPSVFVTKILASTQAPMYPEGTTHADLLKEPRGSGPYTLGEVVSGASRKLERNPNYFKPGLPYLDGYDIVFVADAATGVANFLTHKTQILSNSTPQYRPTLEKMVAEGKINFEEIISGCAWGTQGAYMNLTKPPFNDLTMRKAVNLTLDRKLLGNVQFADLARAQLLFYQEGTYFGQPESQIWDVVPGWGTGAKKKQEIEEAKKLVIQAGYPNGLDIDQMARTPFSATFAHEAIQQQLREVGIRTTFSLADSTMHQNRMTALDYILQTYLFCIPTADPDDVVGTYWVKGGSRNWTGHVNPEVDRLFPLMSGELDQAKRKQLFDQIRDIIVLQTVAYAPTQSSNARLWWWKSLRGFVPGMDGNSHNSSGWHRGDRMWIDK